MRKILILLLFILILSCSTEDKEIKIALISQEPFGANRSLVLSGARRFANEYNIPLEEISIPTSYEVINQIDSIKKAIDLGFTSIILHPISSNITEKAYELTKAAGVDLILIKDNFLDTKSVSTDIENASNLLISYLRSFNKSNNILLCFPSQDNNALKIFERKIALFAHENNIFFNAYYTYSNRMVADKLLKDYISSFSEATIITFDETSSSALIDLIDNNKDINFISFGSSINQLTELEKERIQALLVEDYFSMGYIAAKLALSEKKEKIQTKYNLITKESMFLKSNQWLLYAIK